MRRLGWFLVGATSAAGVLVAAPRLYERLRGALGGGDPWTELEPEERQWGVLREAPPIESDPEPWVAEAVAHEPVLAEAEPEVEPESAPESEPEYTTVWSPQAVVAEAPVEEAPAEVEVVEPEPEPQPEAAAEAKPEQDDDTDEITFTPLTSAPPPDDSTASELRSRIQASRARLRRKARTAGGEDAEAEGSEPDELDEPDEPDSSA